MDIVPGVHGASSLSRDKAVAHPQAGAGKVDLGARKDVDATVVYGTRGAAPPIGSTEPPAHQLPGTGGPAVLHRELGIG